MQCARDYAVPTNTSPGTSCRRRFGRQVAASAVRAEKRVAGRDPAVLGYAEDLPEQNELIASGVVSAAAAASRIVAVTVANTDVEIAVLAEMQVTAVVLPCRLGDVVDQHDFGSRIDGVGVTERET